jgi:hypothetical protein
MSSLPPRLGRRSAIPRLRLHGAATLLILDSVNLHVGAVRLLPVILSLQLVVLRKVRIRTMIARTRRLIERRVDDHSSNNVPRDKEFESEKDGTPQVLTTDALCAQGVGLGFKRKRAVAMIAPMTMTDTPAVSTAVPTNEKS